ncbi:MAG: U32 family peptidase [Eubacterium sp.]|nr:U32 family peptidase [Eubacterium sp.]
MSDKMKVELLAPGGSYESVLAALNAGADAVYTGGEKFGARASADNLTTEQLIDAIHYAHLHHKKLYLTINTLLKNKELEQELCSYLEPLYKEGLDAVIVQDFGVICFLRKYFPKLPIHASTQMTIFGSRTVNELKRLGVSRIVTPRELSLKEISAIYENTGMEIESFVHGALCYCYSGQCLMSSFIGGRSGNRGRCAQPCRMEYDLKLNNQTINAKNEKYILSPKDICTLKILPEIIESGVYSLKIEGRMKKLEYITGVVEIYRKYLDLYLNNPDSYKVSEEDINKLLSLFNRNGFHESYYKQHNGRNMMSLKKVAFRAENEEYTNELKEKYSGKKLKESIDIYVNCKKNEPISIQTNLSVLDAQNNSVKKEIVVFGAIPESAQKRPLDEDTVRKQISKLGNTDFVVGTLEIDMDSDIFLPVSEIKELRRSFINQITEKMLEKFQRYDKIQNHSEKTVDVVLTKKTGTSALVWNSNQLKQVLSLQWIETIYLEMVQFPEKELIQSIQLIKNASKKAFLALPYVFRKKNEKILDAQLIGVLHQVDGVLVRNIEQYFYLKEKKYFLDYRLDYNVYLMNNYSVEYYESLGVSQTAPLELNYKELRRMNLSQSEMILYGKIPLMVSAGCGLKSLNQCRHQNQQFQLIDRKNNTFTVQCVCDHCYNLMLNCKALSLLKYIKEIETLNCSSYRFIFTTESEKEVAEILEKARRSFKEHEIVREDDSTTRGHFQRGVL